ncbi:unnamed protein product, partial [Vitis vinifera]
MSSSVPLDAGNMIFLQMQFICIIKYFLAGHMQQVSAPTGGPVVEQLYFHCSILAISSLSPVLTFPMRFPSATIPQPKIYHCQNNGRIIILLGIGQI